MAKYKIIDLFAGCGGLCDGFEQTGFFYQVACVEWEKAPRDTLVRRLEDRWGYADAQYRVARFDIQRTDELFRGWTKDSVYGDGVGLDKLVAKSGHIDLIVGGPPCQAYSIAGRIRDENGMQNDYRNYLFECYLKVVDRYKPKAFVFENVTGILSARPHGINIIERIRQTFLDHGYELINNISNNAIVDLVHFGVPQKRSRVILLGLNRSKFTGDRQKALSEFYNDILPAYRSDKVSTVRDAIGNLPALRPVKGSYKVNNRLYSHKPDSTDILNHYPRYHNSRDRKIFYELAADLDSGKNHYVSVEAIKQLYAERTGRTSSVHKYYVLRRNEPSNTIPAHLYKDGLRHVHYDPKQARSITVREAARLQTFDDDFEFLGSMGDQYKMIGNAVPPLFSKRLGYAVKDLLHKYKL
ncbi:MAG: DNA cytosine methyltransferase [Candidatus Omnitrophica bacterium]|nr:DNA cytosine methyltransferase [Candidatus Omnitrophota bacterium]MDD5351716.1 DNA cytosine methyltransferase [Candidatus Omnitrophota bacterium]MDD5550926.1 DNA cytosine methyltransferase [Candidatus Omnitrophota bacterium]